MVLSINLTNCSFGDLNVICDPRGISRGLGFVASSNPKEALQIGS